MSQQQEINAYFDGSDYDENLDKIRLSKQITRIFDVMNDGEWRTLREIEDITHDPQASISAQLRHLRKERFGSHIIEKRRRGEGRRGVFEYKLITQGGLSG